MKKILFFAVFALIFAVSCSNTSSKIDKITDDNNDPWTEDSDQNSGNDDDFENPDSGDTSDSGGETTDSDANDEADTTDTDLPDNDDTVETLDFESGFIAIESVEFSLKSRDDKSGKAMLWYNFQPADENPEEKPLFVLYNGGPGSSSGLVFLYNTAKRTADQAFSEDGFAENPSSWTQFGNLLYVDARQTGFSYGIIDDPENRISRSGYFSTSNFSVFVDAGDFIRVILRFLKKHPRIESNPVILAGESYGGTRSTAILNILLNVADYAENNRKFYDETLFNEIADHFQKIDSSVSGMPSKDVVAKQFGRQIMIQPLVAGEQQLKAEGELLEKSDSPLYIVQEETGRKYTPCGNSWNCDKHNRALQYIQNAGRDIYAFRKPYNWLFDYTDVGTAKMLQMPMFAEFILNDPKKINELYAENRIGAFRYGNTGGYSRNFEASETFKNLPELEKIIIKSRMEQRNAKPLSTGNLESVFGTLPPYDEYFVDLNYDINSMFYSSSISPYDTINGDMFLENIKTVKTFITQAEEDIIIFAKGIPESLKSFNGVSNVTLEENSFTVNFSDGQTAFVTFPFYPESSHSVSVNQPVKFFNDVKEWLNQ